MTNTPSTRFEEALVYATRLHEGQVRKGTQTPYIAHLLSVAGLVLEAGGSEDQVIAALLHDGPEDQGGEKTLQEIRQRFGDAVADIVAECSDTFEALKPPWKQRKLAYLEHLATASSETLLVSCADKVHNARSIVSDYRTLGEALWGRFNGGREGTLWYYRALLETFRQVTQPPALYRELEIAVAELERLTTDMDSP